MSTREDRLEDARDWARELLYGDTPTWLPDCMHALGTRGTETCQDYDECARRHIHCTCSEAHEQETLCRQAQREWPADVDVRTDPDDD